MRLHQPISPASFGGTRNFVFQIPSMDKILMGYWVVGHVRTIRSSVMYKSKFRMGDKTLSIIVMIACEILLRAHLRITRSISMLDNSRGRVDSRGDAL